MVGGMKGGGFDGGGGGRSWCFGSGSGSGIPLGYINVVTIFFCARASYAAFLLSNSHV